jgi:ribosomal protein S18 acetylase RimI-like enzyme
MQRSLLGGVRHLSFHCRPYSLEWLMPTLYTRHHMSLDLTTYTGDLPPSTVFAVKPMQEDDLESLALLELEGYYDTPDWDLVPELQTLEGCRQWVTTLFSGQEVFRGEQGIFKRDLSFKAVTIEGEALCGAIYTLFTADSSFIIDFAVAPEWRRQGVGRILMTRALEAYRDNGYSRAELYVTAHNDPALKLYKSMGYKIESTFTVPVP